MREDNDRPMEYEKADRIESKRKMPRVPDLSAPAAPRTTAPFLLDDFGGSSIANTTKP